MKEVVFKIDPLNRVNCPLGSCRYYSLELSGDKLIFCSNLDTFLRHHIRDLIPKLDIVLEVKILQLKRDASRYIEHVKKTIYRFTNLDIEIDWKFAEHQKFKEMSVAEQQELATQLFKKHIGEFVTQM